MSTLTAKRVEEILFDCLFTEEEMEVLQTKFKKELKVPEDTVIVEGVLASDAVIVEGVLGPFGFHPGRLESHRSEVVEMIKELPTEFLSIEDGGGGGWSFLNLPTKDGTEDTLGRAERCEQSLRARGRAWARRVHDAAQLLVSTARQRPIHRLPHRSSQRAGNRSQIHP